MDTASIRFEDEPEQETVLRISGVPLRLLFDIQERPIRLIRADLTWLAEQLAPYLVSWTYPEPADATGLLERDPNWLVALRREWIRAIAEVPLPLAVRSSDGGAFQQPPTSPTSSSTPSSSIASSDATPDTP